MNDEGLKLIIEVDECEAECSHSDRQYRISLSTVNQNGVGSGYRMVGPKYNDDEGEALISYEVTADDARRLRATLDRVFPL